MNYILVVIWLTNAGPQMHSIEFGSATQCYEARDTIKKQFSPPYDVKSITCLKR